MDELIKKILEIESSAEEIVAQAELEKKGYRTQLASEIQTLRQDALTRVEAKIAMINSLEQKDCEQMIEALNNELKAKLHAMNEICDKNQSKWVDAIFSRVVAVDPA